MGARGIVRARDVEDGARSKNIGEGVPGAATQIDNFGSRLLKYIPGETITYYAAAQSVLLPLATTKFGFDEFYTFLAIVFLAIIFNALWIFRNTDRYMIIGSTVAFVMWVFLLGGEPINNFIDARVGIENRGFVVGAALAAYTSIIPLLDLLFIRKTPNRSSGAAA